MSHLLPLLFLLLSVDSANSYDDNPSTYPTERLQLALEDREELQSLYSDYMETYGHRRPSCQKTVRLDLFLNEIREVLELRNRVDLTWTPGINFMADMTDDERRLMSATIPNGTVEEDSNTLNSPPDNLQAWWNDFTAPEEFDGWRDRKLIGPIHDQKKGTCWAHASVVILEAQLAYYEGRFEGLSVEELHHCVYKDGKDFKGSGGRVHDAIDYVIKYGRLASNKDCKETASWDPTNYFFSAKECKKAQSNRNALEKYHISLYSTATWDLEMMYKLVCTGPVSTGLDTKRAKIDKYKGGLFIPAKTCNEDTDHAMAFVGYTKQAYIIRNSWGTKWGVDGYLYYDRTAPACGLWNNPVWARLEPKEGRANNKQCRLG